MMRTIILLAAVLLTACEATITGEERTTGRLPEPEALQQIPLRAGFYVNPSVRRYSIDESWARFSVGQEVEAEASDRLSRAFQSVRPVAVFPDPGGWIRDVDVVVSVDRLDARFRVDGFASYAMALEGHFAVHTPDGKPIVSRDARSSLTVSMGSLDPGANIRKAHEGVSILAREVVAKFLVDLPRAEIAARAEEAKELAARTGRDKDLTTETGPAFPRTPLTVTFAKEPERPGDIAVIVGNADYGKLGKDIPDVIPAYADAAGIRLYVTRTLGVKEGNVIDLKDATSAQLVRTFGSKDNPRGQLYDWVRPGESRVFVYYAGHGAPAGKDGSAYIVPSDADGSRIELNGYPLSTLYRNLGMIPAKSVTVVLEACFSGASQAGSVIRQASPIYLKPKTPPVPKNVTVIAAGAPDQMASWEKDSSHGLFTKYFLKGMSGEADKGKYGNGDGKVAHGELQAYLKDTLTYYARRHYGRDQTAQIVVGRTE